MPARCNPAGERMERQSGGLLPKAERYERVNRNEQCDRSKGAVRRLRLRNADRKKAENPHEKQNPGSIDLQCPGESKWRDSNPRPFGPEFENVLIFPTLSANFRNLPVFSAFFRLFPPVSGNFEAVLNWTFGIFFTFKGAIPGCNRSGCSIPTGRALPLGQTFGSPFGSMPIFTVKSPSDLSYCARLIAPRSRKVSSNCFCRR